MQLSKKSIFEMFKSGILQYVPALMGMALYIAYVSAFFRFTTVFEFDPDEGNNLIKALLPDYGYSLSKDIWSDQPPGFTYILFVAMKIFGWNVTVARAVVLGFAGIIVFVVYEALRRSVDGLNGHLAAIAGCLALSLSTLFMQLSVSVMIGLPAIGVTTLGLLSLNRFVQVRQSRWLLVAGALMGAALSIKMFVAYLVPLCAVYIVGLDFLSYRRGDIDRAQLWRNGAFFVGAFALVTLIWVVPLLIQGTYVNLVDPHRIVSMAKTGVADGSGMLRKFLREDIWMIVLAMLGAYRAIIQRHSQMLLWGVWFFASLVFLLDHYPVWIHHRLLITVPGAVLAGFAISGFVPVVQRWKQTMIHGVFAALWLVAIVAMIVVSFPHMGNSLLRRTDWAKDKPEKKVQAAIEGYLSDTKYMVTARQIYAFRAKRPIPPSLAITSAKRFKARLISAEDIVKEIVAYKPEVVVVSDRWSKKVRKRVKDTLKESYEVVYSNQEYKNTEVWVQKRLVIPD